MLCKGAVIAHLHLWCCVPAPGGVWLQSVPRATDATSAIQRGSETLAAVFKNKLFFLSSEERLQKFLRAPWKCVPVHHTAVTFCLLACPDPPPSPDSDHRRVRARPPPLFETCSVVLGWSAEACPWQGGREVSAGPTT